MVDDTKPNTMNNTLERTVLDIGGLFCGGLLGLVVAALVTMGARETEKELDDGFDEVMNEIEKKTKENDK